MGQSHLLGRHESYFIQLRRCAESLTFPLNCWSKHSLSKQRTRIASGLGAGHTMMEVLKLAHPDSQCCPMLSTYIYLAPHGTTTYSRSPCLVDPTPGFQGQCRKHHPSGSRASWLIRCICALLLRACDMAWVMGTCHV